MSVPLKHLSLFGAVIFCGILVLQYPMQTTFPIGGDAVRYIARAQEVSDSTSKSLIEGVATLARNSNYPIVTAGLAVIDLGNPDWPGVFVWIMALAYLATGLALGWLVYRQYGWTAGVIALSGWGLTTMLSGHFEDATLAQLLSLPFLLLALERWSSGRTIVAIILTLIAGALHPMTALFLGLLITLVAVALGIMRRSLTNSERKKFYALALFVLIIVGVGLISSLGNIAVENFEPEERGVAFAEYLKSPLGPLVLLAPIGLSFAWLQRRRNRMGTLFLVALGVVSMLTSFNTLLGVNLFAFRFEPYLLLTLVTFGAIGLSALSRRVFPSTLVRAAFLVVLFGTAGVGLWQEAAVVYNVYESPSQYSRVHGDELAAIAWLHANLPAGHIVSTSVNRHSEWIPVLSHHTWEAVGEGHNVFQTTDEALRLVAKELEADAIIFFGRREPVSPNFTAQDRPLYENGKVTIYDLR